MSYISNENALDPYESSGDTIEQITSESVETDENELYTTESLSSISEDNEDISVSSDAQTIDQTTYEEANSDITDEEATISDDPELEKHDITSGNLFVFRIVKS